MNTEEMKTEIETEETVEETGKKKESRLKSFVKNATGAVGTVADKTEELIDLKKVKIEMKAEKEKLDGCYRNIGELYYGQFREGTDNADPIAAAVSEADEIAARISELEVKLAALQNNTICPCCKKEVSMEAAFCQYCGTKFVSAAGDEEAVAGSVSE